MPTPAFNPAGLEMIEHPEIKTAEDFQKLMDSIPYAPPRDYLEVTPQDVVDAGRKWMERMRKSVVDHDAGLINRLVYANEREIATCVRTLKCDQPAKLTAEAALEQASQTGNRFEQDTWFKLSLCLERRSGYLYRLF